MSRVKVKLADNIARVVFIETDATVGATLLTDLKLPNGQVATLAQLQDFLGITTGTAQAAAHRLLAGLSLGDDHPQYTRKDTLTTRGDLYARGPVTVQRLALGTDRQVFRAGALDPAWETVSPTLTLGTDLSGSATFTDLGNATLNAVIVNNAVTDAKLRDSAGLSVIGRSGNSTGDPADIVAASDTTLLRRSGTSIGFGTITSAYVSDFTEAAQDAVGAALTDSARIDFTYSDAGNTITADLIADSVDNTFLANMAQAMIKGRAAGAGTGDPTDLTGAQVATIVNSSLDHGALLGLADDDHPQYVLRSILTANGDLFTRAAGAIDRVAIGTASQILRTVAGAPTWQTISPTITLGADLTGSLTLTDLAGGTLNATVANDAITNAKAANMAQSTIKGRAEGAGTGDPTDLTPTQVVSVIDGEAPTWSALHTFTANILLESVNPRLLVQETGLSADTGMWDLNFDAGAFDLRTRTDADGAGANILRVTRPSGSTTPSRVYIGNQVTTDPSGFNNTADNLRNYDFVFSTVNNSSGLTRIAAVGLGAAAGSTGYNTIRWNTSFSSPTQIQSADVFGTNRFGAYNSDTASIIDSVVFRGIAKETWTATAAGAAMQIRTIAAGTTSLLTTLEIFGNQVMRLDGSAAAPSDSYQNDTDTGWYRIGANNPGLSTGGTLRWDISTTAVTCTLPLRGQDGTAAAPAYSWSGDTNTGLYGVGADDLGISTGGTLRWDVSTTAVTCTLPLRGQDGTAAAPAYSWSGDTDNGLYRIGADNIGISTGGTLRWDIDTARILTTLPQRGPDGTAAAPTYAFSGTTTKGMYSVGTNQVGLSANSTLQFEVGDSYSDMKTQARFTGEYRPAQYTANQDNIALPATASVFYFSTDASRNLTGLQGGVAGRMVVIINNGTQAGVLVNDATSTAANRFLLATGTNTTLQAGGCCIVLYDGTASRWRQITRGA